MSTETKCNYEALGKMGGWALTDGASGAMQDLQQPEGPIDSAVMGLIGTQEAQTCAAMYKGMCEALADFSKDVYLGHQSLGSIAVICADNYKTGDLAQQQAMYNAMYPADGALSVDAMYAQAQKKAQQQAAQEDAHGPSWYFKPDPDQEPVYAMTTTTTDKDPLACLPPTPEQQVIEHNKVYGKMETWLPPAPTTQNTNVVDNLTPETFTAKPSR